MTDRAKFEQMLEFLINEDKEKAEELFHELVVAKSREIYENLLDDDVQVEGMDDEAEEEMEEDFDADMNEVGGDETDDMMSDVSGDMGSDDDFGQEEDEGGEEPATKDDVLDIKDALEDLKAEFEAMLSGHDAADEEHMDDEGDEESMDDEEDDEMPQEGFVREYVEKVPAGHGAERKGSGESNVNARSAVAGKNDMGGTASNIARGGVGSDKGTAGGLLNPSTKDMSAGNVNVPGSKTATKMSNVTAGHGAEKRGHGETGVDAKSIIGGRK